MVTGSSAGHRRAPPPVPGEGEMADPTYIPLQRLGSVVLNIFSSPDLWIDPFLPMIAVYENKQFFLSM